MSRTAGPTCSADSTSEVADRFTRSWEQLTGRQFNPWADVMIVIGMLDDLRPPPNPAGPQGGSRGAPRGGPGFGRSYVTVSVPTIPSTACPSIVHQMVTPT